MLNRCHRSAVLVLIALAALRADEREVRRIQERFMAPCCWQENVAVHRSEVAGQMRAEIARMVASGKTEEQIVDMYVARYGERILREPRGARHWWLMLVPVGCFVLATAGLVAYIRRQRRASTIASKVADLPPLADFDLD